MSEDTGWMSGAADATDSTRGLGDAGPESLARGPYTAQPPMGATPREWFNELDRVDEHGMPVYTVPKLEAIASDPKSPHSKAIAARDILQARVDGWDKLDRIPKGAYSRERIMDRTSGKPTVSVQVEHKRDRSPHEIEADLIDLVRGDPGVLDNAAVQITLLREARRSLSLLESLRPIIAEHRPELLAAVEPIETTATVRPAGEPNARPDDPRQIESAGP